MTTIGIGDNMNKKRIMFVLGIILIVLFSLGGLFTISKKLNFGLDLQGGFEILYELEGLNGEELTKDNVTSTYKSIQKRIDVLGVSEPEISIEGDNRIRIRLAGVTNMEEARNILSKPVNLTFRDVDDNLLMTSAVLAPNGAKVTVDEYTRPAIALKIVDTDTFYDVTNRVKDMTQNMIVIWLDYDEDSDAYKTDPYKCDDIEKSNCLSAARVSQAFASDVIISGDFTSEEVGELVELINSGSMPTKLNEISSRTVDASFGADALSATTLAGIIGIILIMLFLIFIYKFSGVITSVLILLYSLLVFTIFYLIGGVLTLPGIAALVLGIGMAVDASIITLERIKEELNKKHSFKEAIKVGNKNSLSTIIDANLTTFLVAFILFIFGESAIKGFATMLIINIIVTILLMVVAYRYILKYLADSTYLQDKLNLFIGFKEKAKSKTFDFIKNRTKFFIGSGLIIIIGFIIILVFNLNLGIDYAGGSAITLKSDHIISKEDVLEDIDYTVVDITNIDNNSGVYLKIEELIPTDEISKLSGLLSEKYNATTEIGIISNKVKVDLIANGIKALIFASIGIIIYITIRFKFTYAIGAVIALLHDILIMVAIFSILRLEVSSLFVAALLAIIGYSINDTIVSFDRIRQNEKEKLSLAEIVNLSLNQTIKRSIFTTITTMIPVVMLIIMGSFEIITFNIALLIGLLAGTYSSIFIASQIWLMLEHKEKKKPKKIKKHDDGPEEMAIKGINS